MPDRDIVHSRLPRVYQPFYKQLCEGHTADTKLGELFAHILAKRIGRFGDGPVHYLMAVAPLFANVSLGPLFQQCGDWASVRQQSESLAHKLAAEQSINSRALSIAQRVVRQVTNDLSIGRAVADIPSALTSNYIKAIAHADCIDRVPMTAYHYGGATQNDVNERLSRLVATVEPATQALADQIVRSQSVQHLRAPVRRSQKKTVTTATKLDDLLS